MNSNLPNLLCVGAQKAATSSLYQMLRQHPQVYVPERKELHFFDAPDYRQDLDSYRKHFRGAEDYPVRVDITPAYLFMPQVAERIHESLGDETKILILLRNPIDRAVSHYRMTYGRGWEILDLEQAFACEPERLAASGRSRYRQSYFSRGIYSDQVERFQERFSSVKIMLFEDLLNETDESMGELYDFLDIEFRQIPLASSNKGVSPRSLVLNRFVKRYIQPKGESGPRLLDSARYRLSNAIRRYNRSDKRLKVQLSDEFYQTLQRYYREDIERLELLIGKDLSHWKEKENRYR